MNIKQIRSTRTYWFIVGCICTSVLFLLLQAFRMQAFDRAMIRQISIYIYLAEHYAEKATLPENLSPQAEEEGMAYNPSAWQMPGQILLERSVSGGKVITFGDGFLVVAKRYFRPTYEQPVPGGPDPHRDATSADANAR